MTFNLTILGCSAAKPAFGRNQTAQLVNFHEKLFLLDCGEGTQLQFAKYKIKASHLTHICISHLHGDHWFGLAGLLCSLNMEGRTEALHLFAPAAALEILTLQLKYSHTVLNFPVTFHALESFFNLQMPKKSTENLQIPVIWEDESLQISAFLMQHSLPCWGFCLEEKTRKRKIIKEKLPPDLPFELINDLKEGKNVVFNEQYLSYEVYTLAAAAPKKYVFCSDTAYCEALAPLIADADLLYHEATYLHNLVAQAAARMHSTAAQAATMAQQARAKKLIIGHFSSRYRELAPFLEEAQGIFPNTFLAEEGKTFDL
jgi:ribonuclease Z